MPVYAVTTPRISVPAVRRDWYPVRFAAAAMGLSERSLRRRLTSRGWVEGVHWRRVSSKRRETLEVNLSAAVNLMNATGWR